MWHPNRNLSLSANCIESLGTYHRDGLLATCLFASLFAGNGYCQGSVRHRLSRFPALCICARSFEHGRWSSEIKIILTTRGVVKGGQRGSRLHPPPLPNIWNNENKCVFYKRTIKVCVDWSLPRHS